MSKTPSSDRVLSLPELLPLITVHLTPPDLALCVLVSHSWNDIFTSSLWHTIDDRLYNWPGILSSEGDEWNNPLKEELDWIREGFQKYGHFICHLSVKDWKFACAVGGNRDHLQLKSLWLNMLRRGGGGGRIVATEEGPVLFPETMAMAEKETLREILEHKLEYSTKFNSDDWMLTSQLWLLTLQTPVLRNLRLFASDLRRMGEILSPVFFRKALDVHLKTLTCLQISYDSVDLVEFLEILPNLQHLYTGYDLIGDRLLNKSYPLLRTLAINQPLTGTAFHYLLKFLPGLEHVGVEHLWEMLDHINYDDDDDDRQERHNDDDEDWRWRTDFKVSPLLDGIASRLRGLHLFEGCEDCLQIRAGFMSEVAFEVLPSLSFLTELTIDASYPDLGRMLAKHCKLLQVFRNSEGCQTIHAAWNEDKMTVVNEMCVLLESCCHLRVFDAIVHQIGADYIMKQPEWVCKGLEFFRRQLLGFRRQDDYIGCDYTKTIAAYETASGSYGSLTKIQQRVIDV